MEMFRRFRWGFVVSALLVVVAVSLGIWWAQGRRLKAQVGDPERFVQAWHAARDAIQGHQTHDGYWVTPYTRRPVFESPSPEVNVFVPALMVDLLEPVGRETGLTEVLERARGYLRRQIEETGLVRYHGRPDALPLAQVGCELPPDSDDTALIWRLAPQDDPRLLHAVRRVLERYRTDEGLYRTWLADPDGYRCFYRQFGGDDPNPADVGIQMHLYLFFLRYDREAGQKLCEALRRRMAEDRIWAWYAIAPLVPLLREIDLALAGCSVTVPDSRLQQASSEQEPYLALIRLLRDLLLNREPPPLKRSLEVLMPLAQENLMRVHKQPPLLYHNDLTASPPHFHWSEDVGYALWLRTYVEVARRWPGSIPLPARVEKTP